MFIIKSFKTLVYIVFLSVGLIWMWADSQIPKSPELLLPTEILENIDNELLNECEEKLYTLAVSLEDFEKNLDQKGQTLELREKFVEAGNNFGEYIDSDQMKELEDEGKIKNYFSLFLKQAWSSDFTLKFESEFEDESYLYLKELYIALKHYPNEQGTEWAKLFCSFYN